MQEFKKPDFWHNIGVVCFSLEFFQNKHRTAPTKGRNTLLKSIPYMQNSSNTRKQETGWKQKKEDPNYFEKYHRSIKHNNNYWHWGHSLIVLSICSHLRYIWNFLNWCRCPTRSGDGGEKYDRKNGPQHRVGNKWCLIIDESFSIMEISDRLYFLLCSVLEKALDRWLVFNNVRVGWKYDCLTYYFTRMHRARDRIPLRA